ncbi:DUF4013 domain-containing protein [Methanosphaera sp. WGK6]|uniref:DUF4013 domain-containing protein n=1 Tax=Methanosphaera sp. WGK6 TaxID=1561964 RepID=UPI00084C1910|nr:DUF4013 domain-containing protein [Methanosphaera sp. WGK6]OED29506.1 hypothetical protein NL43_07920 [Methanosphaera sp. WGK6]
MDIQDIIKESVVYPTTMPVGWIVITALLVIDVIMTQIISTGSILAVIAYIVSAIVSLLVIGLNISIMHNSIHNSNPNFSLDLGQNISDGIKSCIISVIYAIIPILLLVVIASISGLPTAVSNLVVESSSVVNNSVVYMGLTSVSQPTLSAAFTSITITMIFAVILGIVFKLLESIARARLADTGSITAALNVIAVLNKIRSIGVVKYVGFAVLICIVLILMGIIASIISAIPYIGTYLSTIVVAYSVMVDAYAYGLIYMDEY